MSSLADMSTTTGSHPAAPLLATLRQTLVETYSSALEGSQEVVHLDYPAHTNVGDAAIWLGERALLRQLGVRTRHSDDVWRTRVDRLHHLTRGRTVLLHGGGSFGDIWPSLQTYREDIVGRCTDARIVQLAQTVHFSDPKARDRSRRVFEAHGDVLLMARDLRSLEQLRRWFDVPSVLCPDAALALGDLRGKRRPSTDPVLVLGRTDKETAFGTDWPTEPSPVDWLTDDRAPVLGRLSRLQHLAEPAVGSRAGQLSRSAVYDAWARKRVSRGLRTLSRGAVVATDRLHAHILCLLLAIPHVAVDNSYGKLRGFVDTWTATSPLTYWAEDRPSAVLRAAELVSD